MNSPINEKQRLIRYYKILAALALDAARELENGKSPAETQEAIFCLGESLIKGLPIPALETCETPA